MLTNKHIAETSYYRVNHAKVAENVIKALINENPNLEFIIYPFGETGMIAKSVLNGFLGIQEYMIVDNYLSKRYEGIHSLADLADVDLENKMVLLTGDRADLYDELRECAYEAVPESKCVELFPKMQLIECTINAYKDGLAFYVEEQAKRETAEYVLHRMKGSVNLFDVRFSLIEWLLNEKVNDNLGMFLEFGVAKGDSINFISAFKPTKTIYGFDSFEGLPEDWYESTKKGAFSLGGRAPKVRKNVNLVKGLFENSLPKFLETHAEKCAFIHVDCDIYSSAKTVFTLLKDRIVSGTVIEFDEYFNYPRWQENEYKAFQEFVKENNIEYEYLGYVDRGPQAAVIIK